MLDMHLPGMSEEFIYDLLTKLGETDRVLICTVDVQLVEMYILIVAKASDYGYCL
jgi:hypothetical protein